MSRVALREPSGRCGAGDRLEAVGWDSAKDPEAARRLSERARAVLELLGPQEPL